MTDGILERVTKRFIEMNGDSYQHFVDEPTKKAFYLGAEDHPQSYLDSLDLVEFTMHIEEEFGINITDTEAAKCVTFQSWVDLVRLKMG